MSVLPCISGDGSLQGLSAEGGVGNILPRSFTDKPARGGVDSLCVGGGMFAFVYVCG